MTTESREAELFRALLPLKGGNHLIDFPATAAGPNPGTLEDADAGLKAVLLYVTRDDDGMIVDVKEQEILLLERKHYRDARVPQLFAAWARFAARKLAELPPVNDAVPCDFFPAGPELLADRGLRGEEAFYARVAALPFPYESPANEAVATLAPWLADFERPAWRPVLGGDEPAPSRYGGLPLVSPEQPWPLCDGCEQAMPLFLQLDVAALPAGNLAGHKAGHLQLFYCTECDGGFEPDAGVSCVRVIAPGAREAAAPEGVQIFPPKAVNGWQQFEDFPRLQELEERGLKTHYDFTARTLVIECKPLKYRSETYAMADFEVERLVEPFPCDGDDKLGGWPCWIQGVEYPACPQCRKSMSAVFQFTGDPIGYMLGDAGIGHIAQCDEHPEAFAFSWSCH